MVTFCLVDTLVLEESTYWNVDTKATTRRHSPGVSNVNIYINSRKDSFGEMFILHQLVLHLPSWSSGFWRLLIRAHVLQSSNKHWYIFSLAYVESSLVETPPFVTCQSLVIAASCCTDCWVAYTSRSLLLRKYGMVGLGFVSWQQKDFFSSNSPTGSESHRASYKQGTWVLNQGQTARASCWPLIPI